MNPNIINLIILLFTLTMLFSIFNYLCSLFFSKIGLAVIALIWLMYSIYKFKKSHARTMNNDTYYDRINTYSQNEREYGRSANTRGGFINSIKEWISEKKRAYHYAKFKNTWNKIQKKYCYDMKCPHCGSEITVFNVNANGRCNYCNNRLI